MRSSVGRASVAWTTRVTAGCDRRGVLRAGRPAAAALSRRGAVAVTTRRGMVVVVVMMMPRVRVARVPPPRQLGRRQLSAALDPMGASWDEGEEDWEGTDVVVEVNDTEQEVADSLCKLVASNMRRCILDRGAFTLAIPGGSAAKALQGLAEAAAGVDWSLVHIFFVNERLEQKNYKLAREVFADQVGMPLAQLYTLQGGDLGPAEEAAAYEQKLWALPEEILPRHETSGLPSFDMILLGMGADGHVGSIYPGSDELTAEEGLVLGVNKPDKMSITMSIPLINAAQLVAIAATGSNKASAVKVALEMPADYMGEVLPVAMIDPFGGLVMWLLDEPAASELDMDEDDDEEDTEEQEEA